jgi:hypothetical protein
MRVICTSGTHRCSRRADCAIAIVGDLARATLASHGDRSVRHDREPVLRVVARPPWARTATMFWNAPRV